MLSVTFVCMVTCCSMLNVVPSGCVMVTCGPNILSCDTKKVLSVELMLFMLSFAKNVTLYCPVRFGMVKLVLNNVLTFARFVVCTVPFGNVMLIDMLPGVVLRLMLSVMFALISIVSDVLKLVPAVGIMFVMFGARLSCMMKVCVSVSLRLPDVSFASMVSVYVPTWLVLV